VAAGAGVHSRAWFCAAVLAAQEHVDAAGPGHGAGAAAVVAVLAALRKR
jgi:hypothetical protein